MDKQKIIQMAAGIRDAAAHVTAAGPENWANLLGIIRTAEAIIGEAGKEDAHGG